jgi:uncharacterized alpha-E superfamily protein
MARYIERAENTARMLDVNLSTSLLPQSAQAAESGWRAMLSISELLPQFDAKHPMLSRREVIDFMVRDPGNSSSIYCCLQEARENARAVRGSLTTEVWETHNDTWLGLQKLLRERLLERDPQEFFEWVKFRSHLSRGVTVGTMLQDEAFHFLRIGSFLERADNTARILDVKFHAVESEFFGTGSMGSNGNGNNGKDQEYDFYHWSAILRSVSGFEVYRKAYRNVIKPEKVAELLILRADMPRSLHHCYENLTGTLDDLAGKKQLECCRLAGQIYAGLKYGRIDRIMRSGLHEFLTSFIESNRALGVQLQDDFLMTPTIIAGAA